MAILNRDLIAELQKFNPLDNASVKVGDEIYQIRSCTRPEGDDLSVLDADQALLLVTELD